MRSFPFNFVLLFAAVALVGFLIIPDKVEAVRIGELYAGHDFKRAEQPYVKSQKLFEMASDQRVRLVQAVSSSEALTFELPGGEQLRASVESYREFKGGMTAYGNVDGGSFSLTVYQGCLSAVIHDDRSVRLIKQNRPGLYEVLEFDASAISGVSQIAGLESSAVTSSGYESPGAIAQQDEVTQDIIFGYTREALEYAGGTEDAMISLIITEISRLNGIYSSSRVDLELYLLHAFEMESSTDILQDINDISELNGKLDDLYRKREEYGADLAVLWHPWSSDGSGVLAASRGVLNDLENGPDLGFVCLDITAAAPTYSLAHELGHCQGCQHDPSAPVLVGAEYRTYAHGYIMPSGKGTVMSWASERVPVFSSPDVSYNGEVAGTEVPQGENHLTSDNARRLNETRTIVASWKTRLNDDFGGGGGGGGGSGANQAPVVTIDKFQNLFSSDNLPLTVRLNASAWDDGLPVGELTYRWNYISGPGGQFLSFEDDTALSTDVTFSGYGTYVVMLLCNDKQLSGSDLFAVTIVPEAGYSAPLVEYLRLYNSYAGRHHFTTDFIEYDTLVKLGWSGEGTMCKVMAAKTVYSAAWYRLFNPASGSHLWTRAEDEYDRLPDFGWVQEGVACHVFSTSRDTAVPMYRLFNPYSGFHLYTLSRHEYEILKGLGWNQEGVACYVYDSSEEKTSSADEVFSGQVGGVLSVVEKARISDTQISGEATSGGRMTVGRDRFYKVYLSDGEMLRVAVIAGESESMIFLGEAFYLLQTQEEDISGLLLELFEGAVEVRH